MLLIVNKKNSQDLSELLSDKLKKSRSEGKLVKHFGKLKRNLDGLQYQLEVRDDDNYFKYLFRLRNSW